MPLITRKVTDFIAESGELLLLNVHIAIDCKEYSNFRNGKI